MVVNSGATGLTVGTGAPATLTGTETVTNKTITSTVEIGIDSGDPFPAGLEATIHFDQSRGAPTVTAPRLFVLYVDSGDGKLKVKSTNGTVTVLALP